MAAQLPGQGTRAREMRCSAASVARAARANLLVGSAMPSGLPLAGRAVEKMLADLVLLKIRRFSSCGERALRQAAPCRFSKVKAMQ